MAMIQIPASECTPAEIKVDGNLVVLLPQRIYGQVVEHKTSLSGVTLGIPDSEEAVADAKTFGMMDKSWWTSTPVVRKNGLVKISESRKVPMFYACNDHTSKAPNKNYKKETVQNNEAKTKRENAFKELINTLNGGMNAAENGDEDAVTGAAKKAATICQNNLINPTTQLYNAAKALGKNVGFSDFLPQWMAWERFKELFETEDQDKKDCIKEWINWMQSEADKTDERNRKALSKANAKQEEVSTELSLYLFAKEFTEGTQVRVRIKSPGIAELPERFILLSDNVPVERKELEDQLMLGYSISDVEAQELAKRIQDEGQTYCQRYVFRKTEGADFAIGEFFLPGQHDLTERGFQKNSPAYNKVEDFATKLARQTKSKRRIVKRNKEEGQEEVQEALFQERYTVTSYYDDDLRGIEDSLSTSDFDEAVDFAWDKYDLGCAIKVKNNNTGDYITIKDGDIDMTDMDAPYILQDKIMEIKDVITESRKLVVESWNGGYLVRPSKDYNNGIINQKDIRTHFMKSFSNANDVIDFYIKNGIAQGRDQFTIK